MSFFDTIQYRLEGNKPGSRFPAVMLEFNRNGRLPYEHVDRAVSELKQIREELKSLAPDKMIWDIEDLSKHPDWWGDIDQLMRERPDINLSNLYMTDEERDVFEVLYEAFDMAKQMKQPCRIESISDEAFYRLKLDPNLPPDGPKNKF